MQQFKTYPGIPPNGVVERPSILRIPPSLPPSSENGRPSPLPPYTSRRCPRPLASYYGNFGRIKWDYGAAGVCVCVCVLTATGIETHPRPDRKVFAILSLGRTKSLHLFFLSFSLFFVLLDYFNNSD